MFGIFSKKKIEKKLLETKRVLVEGCIFEIKKIDIMDYIDGSKAMVGLYDTYRTGKETVDLNDTKTIKKMRDHMADVFMASVIEPKLKRKDDPDMPGIYVRNLFTDWGLAFALYEEILGFTYGKKKLSRGYFRRAS